MRGTFMRALNRSHDVAKVLPHASKVSAYLSALSALSNL